MTAPEQLIAAALAIHYPCHTADTEPFGCLTGHSGCLDPRLPDGEYGKATEPTICMECTYDDRIVTYPCPTAQALGITASATSDEVPS